MPLLQKHWPALGVAPGARVLVPLCGKTLDMLWLAEQGLHVLGVDLAPLAIESFLHERPRGAAERWAWRRASSGRARRPAASRSSSATFLQSMSGNSGVAMPSTIARH
ncbi:MAG: hypothetical protein U1F23_02325 [Lysobacterales bacterium]